MRCEHQQGCNQHKCKSRIAKHETFLQPLFPWRFYKNFFRGWHTKDHQNEEQANQNPGDRDHFDAILLRKKADHQRQQRIQTRTNPSGYAKIDVFSLLAVVVMGCVDERHDGIPEQDQKTHEDRASPCARYEWHDNADCQVGYGQHQDHVTPGNLVAPIGDPAQNRLQQGC